MSAQLRMCACCVEERYCTLRVDTESPRKKRSVWLCDGCSTPGGRAAALASIRYGGDLPAKGKEKPRLDEIERRWR